MSRKAVNGLVMSIARQSLARSGRVRPPVASLPGPHPGPLISDDQESPHLTRFVGSPSLTQELSASTRGEGIEPDDNIIRSLVTLCSNVSTVSDHRGDAAYPGSGRFSNFIPSL